MIKLLTLYFSFVLLVLLVVGYLVYVLKLPSPRSVVVTVFLVIMSPLFAGYLLVFYVFPAPEVEVPDVTWHSSGEAFSLLRETGLKPRISNKTFDKDIPAGRVIEQRPNRGKLVKHGRIVNLTISTGQRRVLVPNLMGRPFSQVETFLNEAGFRIGATMEVETEQFQTGIIISQLPSAEVEADAGSRIDIFISKNPKFGLVKMPYLIGKKLKDAEDMLSDLKLGINKIGYQETDIVSEGVVMRQEPIWEEEVSVGSSVKLIVSKEPPKTATGEVF
ncbi:MAG: PASTA domain-containing protein [bacterium]